MNSLSTAGCSCHHRTTAESAEQQERRAPRSKVWYRMVLWRREILWGSSYLHVPLAHHDLRCVRVLHQLLQGLGVNVVQRHVRLAALTHLIWGNTDTRREQSPTAGLFPLRRT